MKTLQIRYIYLILAVLLISCQHENEIPGKKEWISTYRYSTLGPGMVLDLSDDDTLLITGVFDFENIKIHKYQIDSLNNIILDDTLLFGNIVKQTNEILIIKDQFRTSSFFPIRDYKLETDTNDLKSRFISNTWQVDERLGHFRLGFTNFPWYSYPSKWSAYYRINTLEGNESFDTDWWSIEKYGNSYFLITAYSQFEYQVYQIKSITDTAIVTKTCWSDSLENVVFVANKNLSERNSNNLKHLIIGTWQLIEYKELTDFDFVYGKRDGELIKIKRNRRNRPFNEVDSVPVILETYFTNREISYSFSQNGECSMDNDKSNLRKSNWVLSNDGKYIHTKNGWMRSMRIISISDSLLITEKHEIIEYPDKNEWTEKYIREKLRKIAESQKVLLN